MEKASLQSGRPTTPTTSAQSQINDDETLIVDTQPHKFMVKYILGPSQRHPLKLILALLILTFGSLITCNVWNDDEKICDRRYHSLSFGMAIGLLVLQCYKLYLQTKLESQKKRRLLSQDAEIGNTTITTTTATVNNNIQKPK